MLAIAFNARAVLVPLVLVFPVLILLQARRSGARLIPLTMAWAGGILLPSLPSIGLLLADTEAFFYNYLLGSVDDFFMN